ncbi:DUF4041 domain-containing protein [Vreelandella aquamarina]|uniref:DUF4041 domain-containing protein n=1 Tax=Vreelandella aquamarina TaxID=77097 RepID=UPI000AE39B79|nr:DUF4041 domain-containing protein [Halomonas axialensis]
MEIDYLLRILADPEKAGLALSLVALLATAICWNRSMKRKHRDCNKLLADEKEKCSDAISKERHRFAHIISEEEEVDKLKKEASEISKSISELRSSYSEKRELLKKLEDTVAVYDERLAFAELGVYEPHFDFHDSEIFKEKIRDVRQQQKNMISDKKATICPTDWYVDNSKSKGQTMVNRQVRLTMRAFNNECEAAIANTRWNNVNAMEKRIHKAAEAINKANASMNIFITDVYLGLKLEELFLTHEYREQLKVEKDERAERARAEREEKKLIAEVKATEKREKEYQQMLEKVRQEAGLGQPNETLKKKIAELEAQLEEAHAESERARAMAQVTRSGYVYIISNVGSFGEDVVKIGLTRRLDPDDRVRELGDASVPFTFDTHAMIYSEEAPALESALHKEFEDRRVNMANMRKEFFRVTLEEVQDAVARLAPEANFFKDREAQDWHETMARRNKMLIEQQETATIELPDSI